MKKLIRMLVLSARIIGQPGALVFLVSICALGNFALVSVSPDVETAVVRLLGSTVQLMAMGLFMVMALDAQLRLQSARSRVLWKCRAETDKAVAVLEARYLGAREQLMAEKARVIGDLERLHRRGNDEGEGWKRGEKR